MKNPQGIRRLYRTMMALLIWGALPVTAWAQDTNLAPAAPDEIRFSVTPYLFLPVTVTGTSTIAGGTADVDLDLGDLFGAMRFAGSLRSEIWRGDLGLILDGYYVNLNSTARFTLPGPLAGSVQADITTKQSWVTAMGAYRFAQGAMDDGMRFGIDGYAGLRWNSLRQEVDASVDIGPGPGIQRTLGGTETWWEPVIGLRGAVQVAEAWTLGARAEIGGLGVNGSNLHWNVLAGADYAPWENASLKLGWQFYGIDFETTRPDGKFAYDVFQTGPYLGTTFRF